MANNKVQLSDGTVLLDLTGDTVTPETLMAGTTAHNAAGNRIVGTAVGIKLTGIAITTPPTKTAYNAGETFDPAGMVVTATYSNGAKLTSPSYTFSPAGALTADDTAVTITYTEGGVTKTAAQAITVTRTVLAIPVQSGSLTYTGSAQSPTWSSYDSTKMTLGGATSGTNAGSYNATFTLKDTSLYCWPDGTLTAKTVAWSISKAAGSLSISPTSMTLDATTKSRTITVTRSGDGTISAVSSNTAAATVSVSGNTVTVTGKANGSATITISVAAGTNYTAPANKTCAVTVSFLKDNFADNDWASIIAACHSGSVPSTWVVGNSKTMTINGASYQVDIIGKNHDTYANGGKAPLTFQLHDCYGEAKNMNSSNTNSGGWTSCAMRSTHLPAILALMPTEVQNGIREVNKLTSAGSQSATINTTADKLFLLSEIEIFGSVSYSKSGEGTQYDYYKAGNSKVKKFNGSAYSWWERSPYGSNSTDFCAVNSIGYAIYFNASGADGVAFGFCF